MRRGYVWVAAAGVAVWGAPRSADAGRTAFGWLYDTDVMPERSVELQQWITEEDHEGATHSQETHVKWGPVIGITDQLELSLPVDLVWSNDDATPGNFTFDLYGIEARYRLVSADPVEAPALVPLIRVAVDRNVLDRGSLHVEADAVATWTSGPVHVGADVGVYADLHAADGAGGHTDSFELHPAGAVSVRVHDELRLGVEMFGQAGLSSPDVVNWLAVGPDLAWTHGRFWLTGTMGIGLVNVHTAPRVIWGIAF